MRSTCPDCGVVPSAAHLENCDVARCLVTGHQRLTCHLYWLDDDTPDPAHDCGADVWTGMWPGEAECIELGWYARFEQGIGWVSTTVDDPHARPDLNRLVTEAIWDQAACRWRANEVNAGG